MDPEFSYLCLYLLQGGYYVVHFIYFFYFLLSRQASNEFHCDSNGILISMFVIFASNACWYIPAEYIPSIPYLVRHVCFFVVVYDAREYCLDYFTNRPHTPSCLERELYQVHLLLDYSVRLSTYWCLHTVLTNILKCRLL